MYDCHYDLLTNIFANRKNIKNVKKYCNKIFSNGIEGGIFNLFYMSQDEMFNELNIKPEEIDVIENLKCVKQLISTEKLIPNNIKYKIGIEGLDYLRNIDDVEILYELGVKSVNPVWNNHNKFGTGIRPYKIINKERGLTLLGRKLIHRLIDRGIVIDLSHSDEETFWDIINECKKFRKNKPKVIASHSNCKEIYNVPRNLTNEQLLAIKEFEGIIGITIVKQFCAKTNFNQAYIKHIKHVKNILGSIDNITLATDDMSYYTINQEYYKTMNIFRQEYANDAIKELLLANNFTTEETNKILTQNYINFWKKTCKSHNL